MFVVVVGGVAPRTGGFAGGSDGDAVCGRPGCSLTRARWIRARRRGGVDTTSEGSCGAAAAGTTRAATGTWCCGASAGCSTAAGVAVAAVASAATPPIVAPSDGMSGRRISSAAFESHASGPTRNRMRPSEMLTNARTSRGSNCAPEQRTISARASAGVAASLYERTDVITSQTSAIATIRPPSGIASPAVPRG